MLIATLEDGRTIMDVPGMKAYLVNFLGDTIIDAEGSDEEIIPTMKLLISLTDGPRENAIERLVDVLFDVDGPMSAAFVVYKDIFDFSIECIGGYYYFSKK